MYNKNSPYTTPVNIKDSLLEKEWEVKSFETPRFIKRSKLPYFFNNANKILTKKGLFKPMRDTLSVFNNNYTNKKQDSINNETLNKVFNSYPEKNINNTFTKTYINNDVNKIKTSLLKKEVLSSPGDSVVVFTSYLEKLNKITEKIKDINVSRNNFKNLQTKDGENQYKKQNKVDPGAIHKDSLQPSPAYLENYFKSKTLAKELKLSSYDKLKHQSELNNLKSYDANKELAHQLNNNIKELQVQFQSIKAGLKGLTNKNQSLYNKLLCEVDKKIQKKITSVIPDLKEIKTDIKNITLNKDLIGKKLKNTLTDIETNLNNLKKTNDLNNVDLELIQEVLKETKFKEIILLLKEIKQDIQEVLSNKSPVKDFTFREDAINQTIINLEKRINISDKENFNILAKQLNDLNKTQEESFKNQLQNKELILNEINSIKNSLSAKPDTLGSLNEKLNDIMSCQKNLLNDAVKIKEYVLSNNKDISYIKDTQSNSNKFLQFIDDLKNNNRDKEKEQVQLSEKMHQDMEIIKKSIIKLIEKQQKTLNNNGLSISKHSNNNQGNDKVFPHKEASPHVVKKSPSNAQFNEGQTNKSKFNSGGSSHISQVQLMAIGKLKEALDLESLDTTQDINKDNINEVIEKHVETKLEKKHNEIVSNKNNQEKDNQSTFVLDTSKFFK